MSQLSVAALAALLLLASAGGAAAVSPGSSGGDSTLHAEPASSDSANWKRPWFCHSLECPQYTVVNVTDDFEVRRAARERECSQGAAAAGDVGCALSRPLTPPRCLPAAH